MPIMLPVVWTLLSERAEGKKTLVLGVASPALSTDCSDKSFVFSESAPRSPSSQWFIASRLRRVGMLLTKGNAQRLLDLLIAKDNGQFVRPDSAATVEQVLPSTSSSRCRDEGRTA